MANKHSKLLNNNLGKKLMNIKSIPKGWSILRIKDISEVNKKNLSNSTMEDYSFYYIDLGAVSEGRVNIPNVRLKYKDAPSRARRVPSAGDVLMSTVRPNLKGFAAVNFNVQDVICSTGFAVITPKLKIDSDFIHQSLYSDATGRQLYRLLVGSNYPAINNIDVENLWLTYPLLERERFQISKVLVSWDDLIKNTINLIEPKIKLKQALMQQLLAGKLRFKDFSGSEFYKTEIGKFLIPTTRPVYRPNNSYTALGIRSHGKGTFLRTVDDPDSVMMDTLYQVKENDLIVNITFAWEGAIAIVKKSDEGALVSHRFPTYTFSRDVVIPEYFKHIIQTKRFVHELGLVSPGGAGRNRVLSKKDFLNIVVAIPSVDEQKKIATLLNGIDREIELLKKKLECLITQKKGLMQKLLTGQIRVKV